MRAETVRLWDTNNSSDYYRSVSPNVGKLTCNFLIFTNKTVITARDGAMVSVKIVIEDNISPWPALD